MKPTTARDIDHFNRWAPSYERSLFQQFLNQVHATLLDLADSGPAPQSVLDVGCGTGRLLRTAAQRWPAATLSGVDPAAGMIDVARQLTAGATFHLAEAAHLPVDSGTVDLVFSSVTLHHWPDPVAGLLEIARVLRRGGRLALADVTAPRWVAAVLRSRAQTARGLRSLVIQAGLEIRGERRLLAGFVRVLVADKITMP